MEKMEGMQGTQLQIEQKRLEIRNKIEEFVAQSPRLAELKPGIEAMAHAFAKGALERNVL